MSPKQGWWFVVPNRRYGFHRMLGTFTAPLASLGMRTADEYLAMAARCRAAMAKMSPRVRHHLALLEDSYSTLASSAKVLARAERQQAALKQLRNFQRPAPTPPEDR